MWAADIPHVNYLQFPNVDRLRFQEKLSGKGVPEGPLPSRKGCLEVCLSGPYQGAGSCFLGGHLHFPFPLQDGNRGGALPQPCPGHPGDPSRGDLRQPGGARGAELPGPGHGQGQGWEPGLQQSQDQRRLWALARGAGLIVTGSSM